VQSPSPLRELDRDLFVADAPLRVRGLDMGARSTLVRLPDGGLFVHSPVRLSDALRAAVEKIGPPRALVAPNLLHHMFVPDWARAFPDARVYAPPGLEKKQPGLAIAAALGDAPPALWAGVLDQLPVHGAPMMQEVVFLHRATKTLLLTDLCFHVRRGSAYTRLFMRANGAWDRFGPSRLMRHVLTRDHAALRASLERILAWDFERVIVTHGDVLERGGKPALRAGFAWLGLGA
jgi:hypothetical protein